MTKSSIAWDDASGLHALGWPVHVADRKLILRTTSGFCGVEVPKHIGQRVLGLLREAGLEGPVAGIPRPAPNYLFIAESDLVVSPARVKQFGGKLWQSPDEIVLPPSELSTGRSFWLAAPRPVLSWLPSLSNVLWALTATVRPAIVAGRTGAGMAGIPAG